MSDSISLKIQIGNRQYPLKVTPDQEEYVQQAANAMNERIREYGVSYGIKDMQDLLAMGSLQMIADFMRAEKQLKTQQSQVQGTMLQLHEMLNDTLKEENVL